MTVPPSPIHARDYLRLAWTAATAVALMTTTAFLAAADPGPPNNIAPPVEGPSPVRSSMGSLRWMIFPPNPPPLGVLVPRESGPLLSEQESALSGEVLEPYFAPLSTYRIEPWHALSKKITTMLDDYRRRREELVAQLRRTITAVQSEPPAARISAFVTLAAAQGPRLLALEQIAEALRASLALDTNWFERREWHLNRNHRTLPRESTAVLEHKVIRASAFYRGDLAPAQRRLLREAARLIEDRTFAGRNSSAERFQFFSPDLMLVRFPADLPAELAHEIELHAAHKEALRQELRDVIYRTDGALSFGRGRMLQRLAAEQEPRIAALEELAEKIRRDLADHDRSWRRSPPAALPPSIQTQLDAVLAAKHRLQEEYQSVIEPIVSTPPSAAVRTDPAALLEWRNSFHERLKQATDDFEREHAAQTNQLEQDVIALDAALPPHYQPLDFGATAGDTVMNLVHRRRVEVAYYEYDIAAFEPGLSSRQRMLLFAAAVAQLDLPLPEAERQPVKAPATILK